VPIFGKKIGGKKIREEEKGRIEFSAFIFLPACMPVSIDVPIRRLSQEEFGEISYEVMRHVFAIHKEFGRFFDEKIYKRELARRLSGARLEVPIDVTFGTFHVKEYLDVLVGDGGLFELKAVESLSQRHHAQLLNYLLLCDAAHGKLINVRPENVEHEFVNTHWTRAARARFAIVADRWNGDVPGTAQLYEFLTSLLQDLGAGLGIALYEDAVTHCFGGPAQVETEVAVAIDGHRLGSQRMRLIAPGVAFKITAFDGSAEPFETHARRLLEHTDLLAIAWVNVNMKRVTFTTLQRSA
jgi:GxxExxY protein